MRGLDYYRHTAFEFVTDRLGAQGTVLGGGRYDGLIEALGGPPTAAVGWAAGIERLAMLLDEPKADLLNVIMAVEDDLAIPAAQNIIAAFRLNGLSADMVATGSARKRYDKATKINAHVLMSLRWVDDQPVIRTQSATQNDVLMQAQKILDGLGYHNA